MTGDDFLLLRLFDARRDDLEDEDDEEDDEDVDEDRRRGRRGVGDRLKETFFNLGSIEKRIRITFEIVFSIGYLNVVVNDNDDFSMMMTIDVVRIHELHVLFLHVVDVHVVDLYLFELKNNSFENKVR